MFGICICSVDSLPLEAHGGWRDFPHSPRLKRPQHVIWLVKVLVSRLVSFAHAGCTGLIAVSGIWQRPKTFEKPCMRHVGAALQTRKTTYSGEGRKPFCSTDLFCIAFQMHLLHERPDWLRQEIAICKGRGASIQCFIYNREFSQCTVEKALFNRMIIQASNSLQGFDLPHWLYSIPQDGAECVKWKPDWLCFELPMKDL